MKTKYISLFFSFVIAFGMMSCSSEIPNGDASKFLKKIWLRKTICH